MPSILPAERHSPFRYGHRSPTGGTQKHGFFHVITSVISDVIPFACRVLLLPFIAVGVGLFLVFVFSQLVFLLRSSFRRCYGDRILQCSQARKAEGVENTVRFWDFALGKAPYTNCRCNENLPPSLLEPRLSPSLIGMNKLQ